MRVVSIASSDEELLLQPGASGFLSVPTAIDLAKEWAPRNGNREPIFHWYEVF